jgi:hypothetical protein
VRSPEKFSSTAVFVFEAAHRHLIFFKQKSELDQKILMSFHVNFVISRCTVVLFGISLSVRALLNASRTAADNFDGM